MPTTTTSRESYTALQASGRLTASQTEVLALVTGMLATHPDLTRGEVEAALVASGGPLARHGAKRVSELVRAGRLVEGPSRRCSVTQQRAGTVRLPGAAVQPVAPPAPAPTPTHHALTCGMVAGASLDIDPEQPSTFSGLKGFGFDFGDCISPDDPPPPWLVPPCEGVGTLTGEATVTSEGDRLFAEWGV